MFPKQRTAGIKQGYPLAAEESRLIASALISNQREKTWANKVWDTANRIRVDPLPGSPKWPTAAAKSCLKQDNLAIRLWIQPHLSWNVWYVSHAPLTLFALKVAALPPLPLPYPSAECFSWRAARLKAATFIFKCNSPFKQFEKHFAPCKLLDGTTEPKWTRYF